MVDRSFLLINLRSICSLIYASTFWDTLYSTFSSVINKEDNSVDRILEQYKKSG